MTTYDLTTFGEAQIRLTVPRGDRLATCRELRLTPAGSEANVAGLLAQLGRRTAFASVIPHGDLAQRFIDEYRGVGVDLVALRALRGPDGALFHGARRSAPAGESDVRPPLHQVPGDHARDVRLGCAARYAGPVCDRHHGGAHREHRAHGRLRGRRGGPARRQGRARRQLQGAALDGGEGPLRPRAAARAASPSCSARAWTASRSSACKGTVRPSTPPCASGTASTTWFPPTRPRAATTPASRASGSTPIEPVRVTDRPGAGDALVGGALHGYLGDNVMEGVNYGLRTSKLALTHYGDLTHVTPSELQIPTSADILR